MTTVAVITGAARGLGAAIAQRIASNYDVVVLADVATDALEATAARLRASTSSEVIAQYCDVSERASVVAAYEAAQSHGELKALVNVAGIGAFTPFVEISDEEWARIFAINTQGAFLMSQEFVRRAISPAAIVHISSVAARNGGEDTAHYGPAKAAVIALSQSIARVGAKNDIRSNAVMPGLIYTDMWRGAIDTLRESDSSLENISDEDVFEGFVAQMVPMGRPQQPEDIAAAVEFFLGDGARNVTGQTLSVDGGMLFT